MSGEWAATETGRTIARLAPSALASSAPASMAGRSPETTTWPGAFRFATTKTPCAEARGDQLGQTGVVEADERGHRAVAALAGGLHQPAALAHEPDAVLERRGRRPRRGPSTGPSSGRRRTPAPASVEAVGGPALAQRLEDRDRGGEDRGLGVLGQVEPFGRAVPGQAADAIRRGPRRPPRRRPRPRAMRRRGPGPCPTDWEPWPGKT